MALPASAASLPPPVNLPEFEGPLDLLLDEVRRQNVAIEDIAMAPIAARFLEYMESAAGRNLNLDIEWLHMAATLIHWKSQSLLPRDATALPQADPVRDDLIRRLIAHRKEVADELARRRGAEETRLSRPGAAGPEAPRAGPGYSRDISVWDLIQQARDLARWAERHRQDRRQWRESFGIEQDDVTIAEMTEYLRNRLRVQTGEIDAINLLKVQPNISRRCCLFLGLLEMARDRELQVRQTEPFGPILLMHQPDRP